MHGKLWSMPATSFARIAWFTYKTMLSPLSDRTFHHQACQDGGAARGYHHDAPSRGIGLCLHAPQLLRALFALKALLREHLLAEEVILAGFSTEPGKGHALRPHPFGTRFR